MARLPPQPRPARDDASLRGDAADDRRRARGQRATTKTPPSGMTLPRKPTPSHRRRRRPGARRAGPRRPGRAVHETRDGARPPSGDAIYWSWLCIWPSRGRRQQSNAAKLSRNGARTAERRVPAPSRWQYSWQDLVRNAFGDNSSPDAKRPGVARFLASLNDAAIKRVEALRAERPVVVLSCSHFLPHGARRPSGHLVRGPFYVLRISARRSFSLYLLREDATGSPKTVSPSSVPPAAARRRREAGGRVLGRRRGASTSGSGRRVSGHAAIAGALRGHGRLRRARQGHGRLAARRRGRPAERNRFCPGFLRRP